MSGVVIIGGGHAAGQAAASLRQAGYERDVTLIGDEPHAPYQRPPLSKAYLKGELSADKVLLRAASFYEDKNITLQLETRATQIDPAHQRVSLGTDQQLDYEHLLICTGSRPRRLNLEGSDLPGIHYLRTMDDVDGIREGMRPGANLVIVGGGYIGLEVASVGIGLGLNVRVLEMEQRILQRVTTPTMSAFYQQLHSDRGVHIHTDTTVQGFAGTDRVEQVLCGDQAFDADIVIVGIGVVPNVELAEAAGLRCENGIVVDEHCRTSDPHIFAAGDCSNHPNPLLGRRLRLESVPNAMEQARVSVANMLGDPKTYAAVPWFWSDQYELKLQMVGFSADGDSEVLRGDMASNQFAIFYLKAGTVVAADAVNSPKEFMICKQLIGKGVNPDDLKNTDFDLRGLLAA
ncbi:MAG: ferredoxin reductase [OM182 bacterium]|nr:MAG: ferredoxin reductase [OM182 bacterium]|tara:strand:- start:9397 stop:10605 length:1209 start_codon:yes stop_codon:yes gene_type:complete